MYHVIIIEDDPMVAAGVVVDDADDFAGVYHIVDVAADGDPGQVDLFGDLLACKIGVPVFL